MKKKLLLLPFILVILLLSACAWKMQGKYFSDKEVIREVEMLTGTEHVMMLGKEEKSGYILYTFRTDIRNIEFTVASYPAGDSGLYNPANITEDNYRNAIHALYDERIQAICDEIYDIDGWAIFTNRSELHDLVIRIEEMDEIYREELQYHSSAWVKNNCITVVGLTRRDAGEDKGDFSCTVKLDGTINADELEEYICNLYKERTGKELN